MPTGFVGRGYAVRFGQCTEVAFLVSLFGRTGTRYPAYIHGKVLCLGIVPN